MMNIAIETDATVLAAALKSVQIDRSPVGCLIRQIRDFMRSEFASCIVSVCNRKCNLVAHCLATHGACVLGSDSTMLTSQAPRFVTELLYGDLPEASA
jgi:hypothetical protein